MIQSRQRAWNVGACTNRFTKEFLYAASHVLIVLKLVKNPFKGKPVPVGQKYTFISVLLLIRINHIYVANLFTFEPHMPRGWCCCSWETIPIPILPLLDRQSDSEVTVDSSWAVNNNVSNCVRSILVLSAHTLGNCNLRHGGVGCDWTGSRSKEGAFSIKKIKYNCYRLKKQSYSKGVTKEEREYPNRSQLQGRFWRRL